MRIRNTAAMNVLGKLLLLFVSFVFSVLAAELLARVVFDPVDYLNPTLVTDEFLNHRSEGHTGGHDEWGSRNARRPETADIVCIGDSMTYGNSALARESSSGGEHGVDGVAAGMVLSLPAQLKSV